MYRLFYEDFFRLNACLACLMIGKKSSETEIYLNLPITPSSDVYRGGILESGLKINTQANSYKLCYHYLFKYWGEFLQKKGHYTL